MVFGSLGGLLSESISLLNPLSSQQEEKDRIKKIGIALIIFGSIAFGLCVTYIILKTGSLMNLDVIVYMTMAIVIGVLPLCYPNATIAKRVVVAGSIFIISLVSLIFNMVLIGIGIHVIVMQRGSLVNLTGHSVTSRAGFTLGVGCSLLVIQAIEVILCIWIIYLSTKLDEIQVVFKYVRWKLGV